MGLSATLFLAPNKKDKDKAKKPVGKKSKSERSARKFIWL